MSTFLYTLKSSNMLLHRKSTCDVQQGTHDQSRSCNRTGGTTAKCPGCAHDEKKHTLAWQKKGFIGASENRESKRPGGLVSEAATFFSSSPPFPFLSLPCTYQRPCTSSIPGREEGPLLAPLRPRLASNFFCVQSSSLPPLLFSSKNRSSPPMPFPPPPNAPNPTLNSFPHASLLPPPGGGGGGGGEAPAVGGEGKKGVGGSAIKNLALSSPGAPTTTTQDRGRVIPLLLLQTPTAAPLFLIACQQKNRTKKIPTKKIKVNCSH